MTPERWQQVARVYQSALDQAPESRAAFLADACRDDSALRREVESLLAQEHVSVLVDHAVDAAAAMPSAPGLATAAVIIVNRDDMPRDFVVVQNWFTELKRLVPVP